MKLLQFQLEIEGLAPPQTLRYFFNGQTCDFERQEQDSKNPNRMTLYATPQQFVGRLMLCGPSEGRLQIQTLRVRFSVEGHPTYGLTIPNVCLNVGQKLSLWKPPETGAIAV